MDDLFKYSESFETNIGTLTATSDGRRLTSVEYRKSAFVNPCAVTSEAARQLIEYIDGARRNFELDVLLVGTDFRVKVWNALRKIPYGETASYGEIARAVGVPRGARAVGNAVKSNPMLIIVPCHRVVAAGGIGGFTPGLDLKRKLMSIENMDMSKW